MDTVSFAHFALGLVGTLFSALVAYFVRGHANEIKGLADSIEVLSGQSLDSARRIARIEGFLQRREDGLKSTGGFTL